MKAKEKHLLLFTLSGLSMALLISMSSRLAHSQSGGRFTIKPSVVPGGGGGRGKSGRRPPVRARAWQRGPKHGGYFKQQRNHRRRRFLASSAPVSFIIANPPVFCGQWGNRKRQCR